MRRAMLLVLFLVVGCRNLARWETATPPLDRLTLIRLISVTQSQINSNITSIKHIQTEALDQARWDTIDLASRVSQSAQTSLTPPHNECGPLPPNTVDYREASDHLGEHYSVQGRVVMVGRSKRAVFLNFHDPYQGYFSGVIFISAWKQFPGRFEDLYTGQCVRISGTLQLYNDAPEIVIEQPGQITRLTN